MTSFEGLGDGDVFLFDGQGNGLARVAKMRGKTQKERWNRALALAHQLNAALEDFKKVLHET